MPQPFSPNLPGATYPVWMLRQEWNLLKWIADDPDQHRINLHIGRGLAAAARKRAIAFATLRSVPPFDPEPHMYPGGPFRDILAEGVKLPGGPDAVFDYMQLFADWPDRNYVESSCAGQKTAKEAYMALVNEPGHRPHILGEGVMFQRQNLIACGYDRDSWIFISTEIVS